jgi:hypothetical protein
MASVDARESADVFAKRGGFRNRHQLNRMLRHASLPSFRVLAAFARILALRDRAEANNRSLCAEVIAAGRQPAWAYRAFCRVTGYHWSDVRHLSHDELIELVVGAGTSSTDVQQWLKP